MPDPTNVRTLPNGTQETTYACWVCHRDTPWRKVGDALWFCTVCGTHEIPTQAPEPKQARDYTKEAKYRSLGLSSGTSSSTAPARYAPAPSVQKKGPGVGFFVLAAIVVVVVIAVYAGSQQQAKDTATSAQYAVVLTGSMPQIQTVGAVATLSFTVQNTGAAIPNYAILFDGIGAWVVDDVSASTDASPQPVGPNHGYAFGPLAANATMTITMDMVPKTAGYQTLSTISYPNVDSNNLVAASTPIDNGGGVQWSVTVNP